MLEPSLLALVNIVIEYEIINEFAEMHEDPLAGLCRELEKMVGQNVVETIELTIWFESDYASDCTRWGELDDVLMGSPESWPALRKVSILFNVTMSSRNDSVKALRELPMTESKQVQFDFEVGEFPYF